MASLNNALLVSLVIGTLIVVCTSVPLHGAKRDDIVEVSLLAEESNPELRVRRAADSNLPDHLSFGFPVQGEQVELRLKRSRLLPTVTSDSTLNAGRFSQDAAVYTDITRGSAMIVKRDTESYTLKGSLVHANQEWSMEPVERQRRDAGERSFFTLHHFVPMDVRNRNMSFVGDAVVDTEEREELVKIWRRQERGDNQQAGQQRNKSSLQPPRQAGERSQLLSQGQQHEKQNRGGNQRHKRAVTQHVVETAFIVDNADYKKWVAMVGAGNAVTEITLWYTFVAESLRIRYETIVDPDIAITTTVTILKILTNAEDSAFIDDITDSQDIFDGTKALGIFRNWVPLQADLPLSDHYMMFTGHDMEGNATFGRAYRPGVCTSLGLSMLENNFDGYVSKAAAHELGHNLNSKHDVEYSPDCEDTTQNIMASKNLPYNPQNEGNRWRFSSCSIKAFKEYLSRVTCTLPENTSGDDELPYPAVGQKAGDRDAQCRRSQNYTDSYFCESIQVSLGIETLCRTMYCARDDGKCWGMTPEEYTPCNTGKWCKAGLCVDIPEQTTTTTTTHDNTRNNYDNTKNNYDNTKNN